jgi:hypothetical protein
MTKPAKIGLLIAAVTLAAVFATAGFANGSGPRRTTIVYHLKYSPFTVIHVANTPNGGYGRGDEIVSWDDLYKGGKKAGRDANACVITNLTPLQAECTITFVTADGTITAQYMSTPPPHKIAAVTGGTAKNLGARGQVVLVESGSDTNVKGNTATFTLLG